MATKPEGTVEGAEASPPVISEFTSDEMDSLKETFVSMGVKPKAKDKDELHRWMADYVMAMGLVPNPSPSPPSTTSASVATPATSSTSSASIPMVATVTRKPWLVKFSGQSSEGYNLWRHQLRSLMKEKHPPESIADAIRSSLHGRAGDAAARLGTDASLDTLVKKMDSIYGEVDAEEDLLHIFYGSRQEPTETVADWGCRLEATLEMLKKQGPLPRTENQMLRTMLWKGLRKDLRDLSGYKYDQIEDFDELRVVLRRIEKQQATSTDVSKDTKKPSTSKVAQVSEDSEIRSMLKKLTAEVASLKAAQTANNRDSNTPYKGNQSNSNRRNEDHYERNRQQPHQQRQREQHLDRPRQDRPD